MLSISYARRVAISLPTRPTVRVADGSRSWRRGRLPLAILIVASLTAVGAAVSAAGAVPPGLSFAQVGHWIANPGQGIVFHVNSAGGKDAQARVPGMAQDSQVVQGPVSGYVVGTRSITRFGKDDLTVKEQTVPPVTDEKAVTIEARGGPYLIFREAGSVVRLGDEHSTPLQLGTPLGEPAVTRDGTLWLYLPERNRLCHLAPDADSVTCVARTGAGHQGAVTVAGDRAAFVDFDDDTIAPLDAGGLGRPRRIGVDLPGTALVGRTDAHGRVAAIDPDISRLYLIDARDLGTDRPADKPIPVQLPAGGRYATPATGRSSVVVLDPVGRRLSTFDVTGRPVRAETLATERGTPRLSRGEDEHVYVDGGEGENVFVVDDEGHITPVKLGGGSSAAAPGAPREPGGKPPAPGGAVSPKPAAGARNRPAGDPDPPNRAAPRPGPAQPGPVRPGPNAPDPDAPGPNAPGPTQPGPNAPGPTQPGPNAPGPTEPGPEDPGAGRPGPDGPEPTFPAPQPPAPPGMPSGLTATAGTTDVVVNWAAAADNGAEIDAYHVTWSPATRGGAVTLDGAARTTTLAGLDLTTRYTITVTAQNSVGRGTSRSVEVVSPSRSMWAFRGAPTTWDTGCVAPYCFFVNLELHGWPPHAEVDIAPWTDNWGRFNGGAGLTTDDEGTLIMDDQFPCADVGHEVWLVVDGVPTNRVLWTSS